MPNSQPIIMNPGTHLVPHGFDLTEYGVTLPTTSALF
jgi:hypothetical protein